MLVYRLAKSTYVTDLSGEGAALYGGRWNHPGVRMLYTASSRALAVLETLVYLNGKLPKKGDFVMLTFRLPAATPLEYTKTILKQNGNVSSPVNQLQQLGSDFIAEGKHLYCLVPSVVVPEERNVIINPAHALAKQIVIVEQRTFSFDGRLA